MKKFWKIFGISLGSFVGLILLTAGIALAVVFTPSRITPIVRHIVNQSITCDAKIERVELTFFSTFPNFGLRAIGIEILNPIEGAQSDTLLAVGSVTANIDLMAFLRRDEISVDNFELSDGYINVWIGTDGHTNFDIFKSDTTQKDTISSFHLNGVDLEHLALSNVNLRYRTPAISADLEQLSATISGQIEGDSARLNLALQWSSVTVEASGKRFASALPVLLKTTIRADLRQFSAQIDTLSLDADALGLSISGNISTDSLISRFSTDLRYHLRPISTDDARRLGRPFLESVERSLQGMKIGGTVSLAGTIRGEYDSLTMPLIDAHLTFNDGKFADPKIMALQVSHIKFIADAHLDLNNKSDTYLIINQLNAHTPKSSVSLSGRIENLLGDFAADIALILDADGGEIIGFLPGNISLDPSAHVAGNISAKFRLSQLENLALDRLQTSGNLTLRSINLQMDSLHIATPEATLVFSLPVAKPRLASTRLLGAIISTNSLIIKQSDNLSATLSALTVDIQTSDPRLKSPSASVAYSSGRVNGQYNGETIDLERLTLTASVKYNPEKADFFDKFTASGDLDLQNLHASLSFLPDKRTEIAGIKLNFTPTEFYILRSDILLGNSDFHLVGELKNILPYFRKEATLAGDFTFSSTKIDLAELMLITSGLGTPKDSLSVSEPVESTAKSTDEKEPYFVPKGIDVTLHTDIKLAEYGIDLLRNIHGDVYIRNGILMLDRLKVKTPAANIQVSARYESPRRNHLFAGVDLHLTDVEISRLPDMIPGLDTLMPMLKSFSGQCEFHVAGETYLFADYSPKMSTIRAAASVKGENLVLLDGETFSEIAKWLMFSKKTRNVVDSLSAEFTVFRNEIDVYPFLLVMDKYKAVVAGRHNLDMSFDYNIELVESPLPFRLAVDVYGNIKKLKFRLAQSKYPDFYRPARREVVESEAVRMRNLIRTALVGNVSNNER